MPNSSSNLNPPDYVLKWCSENNHTDPEWTDKGWRAFPSGAVMSVPVPSPYVVPDGFLTPEFRASNFRLVITEPRRDRVLLDENVDCFQLFPSPDEQTCLESLIAQAQMIQARFHLERTDPRYLEPLGVQIYSDSDSTSGKRIRDRIAHKIFQLSDCLHRILAWVHGE